MLARSCLSDGGCVRSLGALDRGSLRGHGRADTFGRAPLFRKRIWPVDLVSRFGVASCVSPIERKRSCASRPAESLCEQRRRRELPGRASARPRVLTELVHCGLCGASYQLESSGKSLDGRTYESCYYNCRKTLRAGSDYEVGRAYALHLIERIEVHGERVLITPKEPGGRKADYRRLDSNCNRIRGEPGCKRCFGRCVQRASRQNNSSLPLFRVSRAGASSSVGSPGLHSTPWRRQCACSPRSTRRTGASLPNSRTRPQRNDQVRLRPVESTSPPCRDGMSRRRRERSFQLRYRSQILEGVAAIL